MISHHLVCPSSENHSVVSCNNKNSCLRTFLYRLRKWASWGFSFFEQPLNSHLLQTEEGGPTLIICQESIRNFKNTLFAGPFFTYGLKSCQNVLKKVNKGYNSINILVRFQQLTNWQLRRTALGTSAVTARAVTWLLLLKYWDEWIICGGFGFTKTNKPVCICKSSLRFGETPFFSLNEFKQTLKQEFPQFQNRGASLRTLIF